MNPPLSHLHPPKVKCTPLTRRCTPPKRYSIKTRHLCSGKLFLDTEGAIFVQQMYNGRLENTHVVQTCPQVRQEAAMKYTLEERLEIGRRIYDGEMSRYEAAEQYGIRYIF